jgi:DNA mismatch repair protein MutS2
MQTNTFEILEFTKILKLISGFAHSDISRDKVLRIKPLTSKEEMEKRFCQIAEIRRMRQEGDPLRIYDFEDISNFLVKLKPEDAILDGQELAHFMPVFDIATDIVLQLKNKKDFVRLHELTHEMTGMPELLQMLRKSIDSEGTILDSASFLLANIRKRIHKLENTIRKNIEEITRDERISVFLQDEFVTKRSGRWVIPVRMDSKGMVQGIVHDVSKSGETAFVEPLSIIHLANELENLIADQKAEEIRILRGICSFMRKLLPAVEHEFMTVVFLDFLNAIAECADLLSMQTPQINDLHVLHIVQARHPILEMAIRKMNDGQAIVPLDIRLGDNQRIMVITGANAGGKTIAIKTIGLLLLMALSGMPIPASAQTSIPMIEKILVDIGDEQSIEQSLSTFSAHISNIRDILKDMDKNSLVLLDELGTGTDPEEGSALACAVLKEIRDEGALVFATTHLAEIKSFVHRTRGMINAAMEFDQQTLQPLYRMKVGEPGQSHALEIAKRFGLPEHVINTARKMLGSMKIEFDRMISDLNVMRSRLQSDQEELDRQKDEIREKQALLEQKLSETEVNKKEILAEAYERASAVITDTKRQMSILIDEIKKKGREQEKFLKKQIEEKQEFVQKKISEYASEREDKPSIDEIQIGDVFFITSLGYDATVSGVNRKTNRLKVSSGSIDVEIPVTDVQVRRGITVDSSLPSTDHHEKSGEMILSRLNVVGLRVDEALAKIEPLINHASLADIHEVIVIHGIGKGLLMSAIHEHLRDHPLVRSFRSGIQEEGGKGVTVVTLQ